MPTFQAIFFDVGSTLIPSAEIIRKAAAFASRQLEQAHLIPDGRHFLLHYLAADAQVNPPHISHIYSDARIVHQAAVLAGLAPEVRLTALFLSAFRHCLRAQIQPQPAMIDLFACLTQAGIQRGIISDGSLEGQGEVLSRLGLLPRLSPGLCFISEVAGCSKNDPAIYQAALAAAGVAASQALMIGDRLDVDVAVPQSVGMKAVLLRQHQPPGFITSSRGAYHKATKPDRTFDSFEALAAWLLRLISH